MNNGEAAKSNDVALRLRMQPGVQRLPNPSLELFILRGFLQPAICEALQDRIDRERRPSTITDDIGVADFRTSETCDLKPSDPLVDEVEAKLCNLLGLDRALAEPLQGQRYDVGQEFKAHTDTFERSSLTYHDHIGSSGQRTWTAMVYLNVPESGGATRFKATGKMIQPETGELVVWNNLLPNGSPNPATIHQGMKVRKGVKHVLTLWFRESPIRSSTIV